MTHRQEAKHSSFVCKAQTPSSVERILSPRQSPARRACRFPGDPGAGRATAAVPRLPSPLTLLSKTQGNNSQGKQECHLLHSPAGPRGRTAPGLPAQGIWEGLHSHSGHNSMENASPASTKRGVEAAASTTAAGRQPYSS